MTIHLLGSEGFIGKAIQRECADVSLSCWSHKNPEDKQFFDLFNENSWKSLLEQRPETVILLSWPGLPNYQKTFHVTDTLPACVRLVESLVQAGCRNLVVAGTCYEYGLQNGSLREDQPVEPVNCYAIAKDALRRTLSSVCEQSGVRFVWMRIFYPYGEGQNPRSLIPSLLTAIEEGQEQFAMSSGKQLRDFLPVQEVAKSFLLVARHKNACGIYNVCSGNPVSLRDFAQSFVDAAGSSLRLNLGVYPDRDDEPLAFWGDRTRLDDLLTCS